MIHRPYYLDSVKPFMNKDLVKVFTGIRRCGKSMMLNLVKQELLHSGVNEEQCICINFENLECAHLLDAVSLHNEIMERAKNLNGMVYVFLDEIQDVVDWERCVNSLRSKKTFDVYITGSNAKLLSGELATHLAGRYIEFTIYPFSFSEFIDLHASIFKNDSDYNPTKRELFLMYVMLGGMPYLGHLQFNSVSSKQYLEDVFNSIVLKDIVKRHAIRDVDLLERIVRYVCINVGNTFSASSLSKYFLSENRKVSVETILNYLQACEDAFLLYRSKREDVRGKRVLSTQEKYFIADHGLRTAVVNESSSDIQLVLENIVYMELRRRKYKVYVGKVGDKEVDFVAERYGERMYIQVSYLLLSEQTTEREFSAFDGIDDHYPKYVLSMDDFNMSQNGIRHMHVMDFLLDYS